MDLLMKRIFLQKIDEIRSDDVQNIGDVLRIWYDECIREMNDRMEQMQTKMSEMSAIMQKVTVQTPGPTGGKNKRIKTLDHILHKLKANFETTMKTELRNNFDPPSEVADIRTLLRDKHHVVVAGSFSSRYLETALFAITTMDYTEGRCVEISTSSDWRHIDPEDVDLVLLKDPFGKDYYESSKAKGIADVFNNMLQTSKEDTNAGRIDIILVTEIGILAEVRKQHDHDILDVFVNVFDATTEKQPADLTLEITSTFIQHYYSDLNRIQVDDAYIKIAKEKFKRSKIVVLVGPKEYGKVLAVALAASYKLSQCLLLTKPDDTLLIDSDVCLAIVDQFAGKYRFSEDQVLKWYDMFDHLQLAVEAGKLNVVITCEKEKLKGCRKIFPHPLLEHTVDLPEDDYNAVKNEVSLEENVEMSDTMDHSTEQTENQHQKRHKKLRRNKYGETPIHIAAKKPHPNDLKKIIASGADVNVRDNANWSPLHEACKRGFVENEACLLQAGADIDALGDGNDTPLHKASMSGNIEMLLDRGANPQITNDDDQTPMDDASRAIYTLIEAVVNRKVNVDTTIPSESEMSMADTIHDGN
ncbi:uncharacterized protein LOC123540541 isoform X2 [Mercenaria mercenaria]|uniref:uncharacterized protein LOC123540541 isoform X2 n=1 Tax=Mercenaria mercenaria TaxID=6596 RepID=UPI00234EDA9E|nr:uncharacterized protein LOC123540541 isoform X2 [Mercenaria mercenaria]